MIKLCDIFSAKKEVWESTVATVLLVTLKACFLTGSSGSARAGQRAGRILPAVSATVKKACVAARALTAAIRAGGNGSRSLPENAGRRTFKEVYRVQ